MLHLIDKKWQQRGEFGLTKREKGLCLMLVTVTATKLAAVTGSRVSFHLWLLDGFLIQVLIR